MTRRAWAVMGLSSLAAISACSTDDAAVGDAAASDGSALDEVASDTSPPTPDAADASDDAPLFDAEPTLPTGRLTIGFWCGLPLAELKKARFDEIAAAGFTHVSNPCETSSTAYNLSMLDLAKGAGLVAIVTDERAAQAIPAPPADRAAKLAAVVADYASKPALYGYHLVDEPAASAFAPIASVVSDLAARDPAHPAIVNLLPVYASAAQLGTPTYDAYVGAFVDTVKPRVFSYDHYNFYSDGSDGRDFFDNLAAVRARAVAAKTPFWQYIQAISFNGHRATTGAEKRWAALHTLAYGGQGVMYFTYWTPPATPENFGSGILAADGSKSAQYAEVQSINATLAAIGKYLVRATSTGVFHNGPLASSTAPREPGAPVYVPSAAPVTVGVFTVFTAGDDAYALIVNRSHTAATETDVFVASHDGAPEILDVASGSFGKAKVLATDPEKGARLHLAIAAGDGVLLHLRGPLPAGAPGAEAFVGTVRADAGKLHVVDATFGAAPVRGTSWNDCPSGYVLAGRDFQSNGFYLCARKDLAARTFYVGNVVSDAGTQYAVKGATATSLGSAGWNTCAGGKLLGRVFESNGFWLCIE